MSLVQPLSILVLRETPSMTKFVGHNNRQRKLHLVSVGTINTFEALTCLTNPIVTYLESLNEPVVIRYISLCTTSAK